MTVTETYTDKLYLSTNQTLEPATDTLLGTSHGHTVDLPPNGTHPHSQAVTIPTSTASGPSFVLVQADALNTVAEGTSGEANNVTAIPLTVGGPAPTATWTTPPAATLTAGQTFQVAWTTTGSPTHVNVHWNPTDPLGATCCQGAGDTTDSSTFSPTSSPVTLTAPTKNANGTAITSPTTVKYVVHVSNANGAGNSTLVTVTVNPATFRLSVFPIPNRTHLTASINSMFDHAMPSPYCPDNRVVAYTGEEGRSEFGSDQVGNITGCGVLFGFKNALGTSFSLKGQYTGGGTPQYLYYDGHPGYDYRTVDQCPGGIVTVDCPTGIRGQIRVRAAAGGRVKAFNSTFGRIEVDHENGYETWYMHLSRPDVTVGQVVSAGQFIGISGDVGSAGSPHLHFEVRLNNGIPVDPYGWEGIGSDPYTRSPNKLLW